MLVIMKRSFITHHPFTPSVLLRHIRTPPTLYFSPSQLLHPLLLHHHIPQQPQPLHSKHNHIPRPPLSLPLLRRRNLPHKRPPLTNNRQRHIPRPSIRGTSPGRPRRPTLTKRIRALQIPPHPARNIGTNLRSRTAVSFYGVLCPAGVADSRGEGVECEAAFVELACAGDGEEGGGDEASCGGFGD